MLIVDSGEFPLRDGMTVTCTPRRRIKIEKVAGRALRIAVPAGFSGVVAIEEK